LYAEYDFSVKRAPFVLALVLVALAVIPAAAAKDWLSFERTRAHVGDRVTVSSGWNAHPNGLVAYLVPYALSPSFYKIPYGGMGFNAGPPPALRGVIELGRARPNGHAASLTFSVPRVAPGRYVLGVWCVPCNEHWTTALPNWQPDPHGILRIVR